MHENAPFNLSPVRHSLAQKHAHTPVRSLKAWSRTCSPSENRSDSLLVFTPRQASGNGLRLRKEFGRSGTALHMQLRGSPRSLSLAVLPALSTILLGLHTLRRSDWPGVQVTLCVDAVSRTNLKLLLNLEQMILPRASLPQMSPWFLPARGASHRFQDHNLTTRDLRVKSIAGTAEKVIKRTSRPKRQLCGDVLLIEGIGKSFPAGCQGLEPYAVITDRRTGDGHIDDWKGQTQLQRRQQCPSLKEFLPANTTNVSASNHNEMRVIRLEF
eukprot:589341-Hanusia_phi.AAC.2